ncbi:hypothetical protein HN51_008331 [Arachis hypogaea]|uniref:Pentatricopeptide repeat-containing protein n=1 Tax=Arachis hypogaea TaxID=3818 RepID=A0A445D4G7_ARAHY|nr:pentatricopeptide repeat-containing protein At4g21065-like [Arachis hypogaea]RYR57924.1 hypothetical protein Ahy_A05g023595 [Arachis hypogaea]
MSPKDLAFYKAQQTLITLFKRCSTIKHIKQVQSHVFHTGFHRDNIVLGQIILFCSLHKHMNYALSVFNNVHNPDTFIWNTTIRGFGNALQPQKAFDFYRRMLREKTALADTFTFSFLLKIVASFGPIILGKQLHCNLVKLGFETHAYVGNSLMHMYGMLREDETARKVFDEMKDPDLVTWNCVIDCHVHCGKYKEALELFTRMVDAGVQPNDATLVVTLSACGAIGMLDFGRRVHDFVQETGLDEVTEVSNSLIDMYAKCGVVEEACETFWRMRRKSVVSWNVMIFGLATHGDGREALALFARMLEQNAVRPDELTLLGVLCACSHGGMVEEGRRYFDVMNREYNLQPTMKHYGCMVDLLGRAGLVEEAYRLIKSMPMECDAVVWRTLLAACRVHGNILLGKKVRSHLLELKADHSSDYVLLASMYASRGQWNEMSRERKSMQERRVQKPVPGNSLIGIPGTGLEKVALERLS